MEETKTAEEIVELFTLRDPAGGFNYVKPSDAVLALKQYANQELTQQQSANAELKKVCDEYSKDILHQNSTIAELKQKLQQANFATSILIDCKEEADFLNKIIELKKQNEELVEVLTTLTDSNLFSNIVHLNARAGGKKKLAEAWEKALELISKHTT